MSRLSYNVSAICEKEGWGSIECYLIKDFNRIEHGIYPILDWFLGNVGSSLSYFEMAIIGVLLGLDYLYKRVFLLIKDKVDAVVTALDSLYTQYVAPLIAWAESIADWVEDLITSFIDPISNAIDSIMTWIAGAGDFILSIVQPVVNATLESVRHTVKLWLDTAVDVLSQALGELKTIVTHFIASFNLKLSNFRADLTHAVTRLYKHIKGVVDSLEIRINQWFKEVYDHISTLIAGVIEDVVEYVDAAIKIVEDSINSLVSVFLNPVIDDILGLISSGSEAKRQAVFKTINNIQSAQMFNRDKRLIIKTPNRWVGV